MGWNSTGIVEKIVPGANVNVDDTNPARPIVSSPGGGEGGSHDYFSAGFSTPLFVGHVFTDYESVPYDTVVKSMSGVTVSSSGRLVVGAEINGEIGFVRASLANTVFSSNGLPGLNRGTSNSRLLLIILHRGGDSIIVGANNTMYVFDSTAQTCETDMMQFFQGDEFEVLTYTDRTSASGYSGALNSFQLIKY